MAKEKRGTWIHADGMMTCSSCKVVFDEEITDYLGGLDPKYCPECGSNNQKEDEE